MGITLLTIAGKIIAFFSQKLKIGGGFAAPGLFALKIDHDLVSKLAKSIPQNVVITGTNGKTTTARLVAHFARQKNLKIIRNRTGSNLERGIGSTLIQDAKIGLSGVKLNFDLGIWELDEAAFNSVGPKLHPGLIIFLNIFRDQLDRYGEVNTVVKNWCETLSKIPKNITVLLNGDDATLTQLRGCFKGKIETFGVKDYQIVGESLEHSKNKTALDFEAADIRATGLSKTSFRLIQNKKRLPINLPLPGIYHIYDFLAAFAAADYLKLDTKKTISSLKTFRPAFGRLEKFQMQSAGKGNPVRGYVCLVKNPAGANQAFQTIAPEIKTKDRLLVALNDKLADGTDVSWIWDAQWEKLPKTNGLTTIASGTRAEDLANRLKYAGFDTQKLLIQPNLEKALKQAQDGLEGRLFILPTYTAMLKLQEIFAKKRVKKYYWQE